MNNTTKPPVILYVEDDVSHIKLVERSFSKSHFLHTLETVTSLEEAKILVNRRKYDLVIADYRLAGGDGLALVDVCLEKLIPLIVLTSFGNESIAVGAIKKGAFDYVVKSETVLMDMPRIAFQAIKEWDLILKRKQSEILLQQITESLITQIIVLNSHGQVILANHAIKCSKVCPIIPQGGLDNLNYIEFLKNSTKECQNINNRILDLIHKIQNDSNQLVDYVNFDITTEQGETRYFALNVKVINNHLDQFLLITIDDMTERYKQQQQLETREKCLQLIKKLSPREEEVLKLVARGISNKMIAHELHLSDRTVEKHRASAMKKLNIKSVADIVMIFVSVAE